MFEANKVNTHKKFYILIKCHFCFCRIRGQLGSTLVFSSNLGLLIMYILGASVPYNIVPYVLIVLPVVFLLGFTTIPDTPFHFMRQNKYQVCFPSDWKVFKILFINFIHRGQKVRWNSTVAIRPIPNTFLSNFNRSYSDWRTLMETRNKSLKKVKSHGTI